MKIDKCAIQIRTMETTDGIYVDLNDLLKFAVQHSRTFPSQSMLTFIKYLTQAKEVFNG